MKVVALAELCDIAMGQAPAGSTYNDAREGLPLIAGASDLGDRTPQPSRWTSSPTQTCNRGDIILCIRATIGDRNWADRDYCLGRGVAGLRAKPSKLEARYLWHWLGLATADLLHAARGATFLQVSRRDIERLQVPIPNTLFEQLRIADILDGADAIRRKRNKTIALTEELLRSTFLDMFGDPVTNPKLWPIKPLGDAADLIAGNSLPSGVAFHGQQDGYLLMKVGDMNTPGNEVDIVGAREWAATVPSASVVAPAGAVVIPKRGGAIATNKKRILARPAALDPNLMAIAPGPSLQIEYLRQWFDGVDLAKLSNGSVVPQLNKKDLAPLLVPVPPEPAQMEFAAFSLRLRTLRRHEERARNDAGNLFSGLVAHAFAGGLETTC